MPVLGASTESSFACTFWARSTTPPHIHAIYGDSTAAFDIRSGRVLDGELPARAAAMVREWIGLHRDDLVTMWETQEFKRIDPLD